MQPVEEPSKESNFFKSGNDLSNLVENEKAGKKKSPAATLLLIMIILIILVTAGVFAWRYFEPDAPQPVSVNPSPSAQIPSPSPAQEVLDRTTWSFEVQNGSGVTGAAKIAADKLTGLGYRVVKVSNAFSSDYTQNQLFIRAEKSAQADLIINDLKADFNIASVSGVLDEGTASARLIIGK